MILSITTIFHLFSVSDITIYSFYQRITNYLVIDLSLINPFVDVMILMVGNAIIIQLSKTSKAIKSVLLSSIFATALLSYFEFYLFLANIQVTIFIVICLTIIYTNIKKKKRLFLINPRLLLVYFSLCTVILGSIGLLINLSYWFEFENDVNILRNYFYEIFLIFSSFSPVFVFIILFALPIKWIMNFIAKLFTLNKKNVLNYGFKNEQMKKSNKSLALGFILSFSVLIVFLPHLPIVNEENKSISVDTGNYGYTIKTLTSNNTLYEVVLNSFIIPFGTHPNAVSGDRPFTFLFITMISKIIPIDLDALIDTIIPMILSPLLVISVYMVVREFTNNTKISLISAFLTTVSPQILVGVYAGFIANWLALIISFFSVYVIAKYTKVPQIRYLVILIVFLIMLRFTHLYTWIVMSPILFLFVSILVVQNRNVVIRSKILKIAVFLVIFILPYFLGVSIDMLSSETNPINSSSNFQSFLNTLSLKNLTNSWENLTYSVNIQNGGFTANCILLILCVGWIFYFDKFSVLSLFMTVLLLLSILPIFLGNDVIQTRMIYNIPFQIPASVTLYYILSIGRGGKFLFISVLLCLITISFRQVSNLIFMYY